LQNTNHRLATAAPPRAACALRVLLSLRAATSAGVCLLVACAAVLAQAPESAPAPQAAMKAFRPLDNAKPDAQKRGKHVPAPANGKTEKSEIETKAMNVQVVKKSRRPMAGDPAAALAANRANLVQQFTTQGKPAIRAELILVRRVCRLNAEALRKLKTDADAALSEVVAKLVDAQVPPRVRFVQNRQAVAGGIAPPTLDAYQLLQDALRAAVKKNLAPDQWARYEAETQKRSANRKRAAIAFIINAIDRELYLSDDQRARLNESLSAHWDESWVLYVDYLMYGNQFYPQAIVPHVTPILSEAQKRVWQGVQKVGQVFGFGGIWGSFVNDNDELAEELGELTKQKS
jgi:hypothetical protein